MTQPSSSRRKSWRPTRKRGVTRLNASRLGWQNRTFGLHRGGTAVQLFYAPDSSFIPRPRTWQTTLEVAAVPSHQVRSYLFIDTKGQVVKKYSFPTKGTPC